MRCEARMRLPPSLTPPLFVNLPARSSFSSIPRGLPSSRYTYEKNDEAGVLLRFLGAKTSKGLAGRRPSEVSLLYALPLSLFFFYENNIAIILILFDDFYLEGTKAVI